GICCGQRSRETGVQAADQRRCGQRSSTGCGEKKVRGVAGLTEATYDGGPVAALRRIAFLMERGREETRRIQAFRNAAAVILPLPADEVVARAGAGTLTDLAGIGPSTAQVIADAVHGELPERLAKLEAAFGPLVKGGDEVRALLRGDLHSHSDW